MASTSKPQTSTPASTSNTGSSRTKDWARSGEPGSAFSGIGRGGRGSGRGGSRGGRGRGGRGAAPMQPKTPLENTSQKTPLPSGTPATPVPSSAKPRAPPAPVLATPIEKQGQNSSVGAPASTPSSSRPKNSRRPSRAVPTVVVAPTTPEVASAPSSGRPQNRRRRSQSSKAPSSAKNSTPSSLDESLLRPQKSRSRSSLQSAPVRDRPPHLDMRTDIDALVERVRAVAMAADNRPTTPGSHIDWAGDDDDSLPDLDDWGVTKSTSAGGDMISPIIVDGLKPLPDPIVKPATPPPAIQDPPSVPENLKPSSDKAKSTAPPEAAPTVQRRVPLHPSLPPKPVVSNTSFQPHSRTQNSFKKPVASDPNSDSSGTLAPINLSHSDQTSAARSAPLPNAVDQSSTGGGYGSRLEPPASEYPGESLSAPSNITQYSPSAIARRNFNPSHTRAHTVGRASYADDNSLGRFSRSGSSTPRGGHFNNHHIRTHSSPSSSASLNHRSPHARPVITGDAISKLARTIGLTSPGKIAEPISKA